MSWTSNTTTDLHSDESENILAALRLSPELERKFRDSYLERNIPRARIATAIYLGLLLIVTGINSFGSTVPMSAGTLEYIFVLRMAVACPALILILCVTEFPKLHRFYDIIVGPAVTCVGLAIIAISAIAATAGVPQFQMGDVLVIVYACLFLGLRFPTVATVASVLVVFFFGIGVFVGVSPQDLYFAGAVIVATTSMAVLSARRLETLERTAFVETRLLNEQAERDGLTALYNRRKFDSLSSALWEQAARDEKSLQLILIDIDCFKAYNDVYGHQAGDDCIRIVASIVARAARRPLDFCARYGGEEFILVLYGPSTKNPLAAAEQIRAAVQRQQIRHKSSSAADVVTVSIGSAIGAPETGRSLAGLIQQADEALYRAKQSGRNRVAHSESTQTVTGAFKVLSA